MIRLLTALPLAIAATAALAQGVPTIDYEASCRAAARASGERFESIDACRGSERNARAALVEQWEDFLPADRTSCHRLTTTGTPGTYTELLTCLEIKREARRLPDRGTVGLGGPARR